MEGVQIVPSNFNRTPSVDEMIVLFPLKPPNMDPFFLLSDLKTGCKFKGCFFITVLK